MKKATLLYVLLIFLLLPSMTAYAHPGRTDSSGGHTNHSTGDYHYHHGYSAHDHYDMDGDGDIDCPYDFDDQTSDKGSSDSSRKKDSPPAWGAIAAIGLYFLFMFIIPFLML